MAEIILPDVKQIGGGFFITYKGTPNKCAYWEVVGFDGASETLPVGNISDLVTINDGYGFSVNRYTAPVDPLDTGKTERIKVSEHA